MTAPWAWSAEEIAARVRRRELAVREVVDASLARTDAVERGVRAYVRRDAEAAHARAAELDARLAAGEDLGPLAGVPVALKDNLSWSGRPLGCGSRMLAGYVAPFTATAVARLEAAGAVVVGQTNLDEMAMGSSTETSCFGPSHNPWDLTRVPGGSSGGAAAAVASWGVPLALGSDTGGSVRQPAAWCGLAALKPTQGRVSRHGLVAFAPSLDQIAPLARSVRDVALALQVIAGADSADSTTLPGPVPELLASIEEGVAGLRLGVLREVDLTGLAADVVADWQAAVDRFARLGATLEEVSVPLLRAALPTYHVISGCEAASNLARFDGVRFGHRGEGFGAEVERRILLGTFALAAGSHQSRYKHARSLRLALGAQFRAAFTRVDLILLPTVPAGAFALGAESEDPVTMYHNDVFTTPASLAGLPAATVPSGCDSAGLPLGLQIVGPELSEAAVLRAARAFEGATAFVRPFLPREVAAAA